MSNTQNNSPAGSNEAPKAPQPAVTPTPQQNQGDKPANDKPAEQQK